ncbi:MAG: glutamate--tRNA ligase [Gemmataceae bacterium]|nr:glutamate--tRNA ligase [Gemmataceae bacterium]
MGPVRTRFAPSPTGYLHIGGVRTALFNWLLARQAGGQFILRIDDTDSERNRAEALQPILDGFRWLGIDWDEGPEVNGPCAPYFQSQRNERYVQAAMILLEKGHAYPCYRLPAELQKEREAAEKAKKPYVHRGEHRQTSPEECLRLYREKKAALRLKVPDEGVISISDRIRGVVEWQASLIGDPIILRPDGRALYNFATVIDDSEMKITHVVRAAEHLSNTPVQALVYRALGAEMPEFAHVPVVNEPNSKKKLSKRDMKKFLTPEVRAKLMAVGWTAEAIEIRDDLNPATVAFYKELGYLPSGLVNYLGRLGWSLDDKTEIIPLADMIHNFSLERVNNSSASFDPDKLFWVAGEYMKNLPLSEKVEKVIPFLQRAGLLNAQPSEAERKKVQTIVAACGDRLKLFSDVLSYGTPFFLKDPLYETKALSKRVAKEGVPDLLREFSAKLRQLPDYSVPTLEQALRDFCQEKQINTGLVIHALRVATTGIEVGPGVFDCLHILGREESIRRIDLALELATPPAPGQ